MFDRDVIRSGQMGGTDSKSALKSLEQCPHVFVLDKSQ